MPFSSIDTHTRTYTPIGFFCFFFSFILFQPLAVFTQGHFSMCTQKMSPPAFGNFDTSVISLFFWGVFWMFLMKNTTSWKRPWNTEYLKNKKKHFSWLFHKYIPSHHFQIEACSKEAEKINSLINYGSPTLVSQVPLSAFLASEIKISSIHSSAAAPPSLLPTGSGLFLLSLLVAWSLPGLCWLEVIVFLIHLHYSSHKTFPKYSPIPGTTAEDERAAMRLVYQQGREKKKKKKMTISILDSSACQTIKVTRKLFFVLLILFLWWRALVFEQYYSVIQWMSYS